MTQPPTSPEQHIHNTHADREGEADRFAATIERLRGLRSVVDELREVYESGNEEHFDDLMRDVVSELFENDPVAQQNLARIKNLRGLGLEDSDESASLRQAQKDIMDSYRQDVINIAGLPDEASVDQYTKSTNEIRNKIADHITGGGDPADILAVLGILTRDEKGQEIFSYPEDLFPKATNQKWAYYLDLVRRELRAREDLKNGIISQKEYKEIDFNRKVSHDLVAKDLQTLLQLDKLPENDWDFEKTRNLIAKMRDHTYPTVETAEKDRTVERLLTASQLDHVDNVIGVLATRYTTRFADFHKK